MGKKKIDKLKLIESKTQRNVAFCKRKRGFLKKAIELSYLCGQQILIIIYDEERGRVVQFSSEESFQIGEAYKALKRARMPENPNNFEKFNNDDYARLEQVDFRSVRYKKKAVYGEDSLEMISDFEGDDGLDGSEDIRGGDVLKKQPDNDGDESIGQIVPKKQSNKRQKAADNKVNVVKTEPLDADAANTSLIRNEKLSAIPLDKADQKLKDKGAKIGGFGDGANQDDSKSLTSNNSLWKMKTENVHQSQQMGGLMKNTQGTAINQMFSQVGQIGGGAPDGNTGLMAAVDQIQISQALGGGGLMQAQPNTQVEQKSSLFDADKIRSLGINNLHTSKREEKSKRKQMMWQGVNSGATDAATAANRNLDNLQSSDRFNRLEKEVAGILNQDMKQQQQTLGIPNATNLGQQQSMIGLQRFSPAQSQGKLSQNLIQQLQQKNKEMSPQIQQLLQQRLKQQQNQVFGSNMAAGTQQSQAMLQQLVQKAQNRSVQNSQGNSPNIPFNQLYAQGQVGKKSPLAQGSDAKISPGLNWPAQASRSPNQRGVQQTANDQVAAYGPGGTLQQINKQILTPKDGRLQNDANKPLDQYVKTLKSPAYGMQKLDGQNNLNLTQQQLAAFYNQKGLSGEMTQGQAQGLTPQAQQAYPPGTTDLQGGNLMQHSAYASLKAAQEAIQNQQLKAAGGPQQKDLESQLSQINMSIVDLVDALHKGQGESTPAQALQDITSISKLIDNSLLSEALNFDGDNTFKAINNPQVQPQQQQQPQQQLPQSYQGLLDDLQSQMIGQIIMNNYGQNQQRPGFGERNAANSGGTPFFQPQDAQRGQAPGPANNWQFQQQIQALNAANQQADLQRGGQMYGGQPSYVQPPQSAGLKNYLQQQQEESNDIKSNFNLSPLLMGSSKGNVLAGAQGSLGMGKDDTTSKRKLQRQIAVARSQINMQESMMHSNYDEPGGSNQMQRQLSGQMPLGLTEQDLQKYGLTQSQALKQLGQAAQHSQSFVNSAAMQGHLNATDKSPQLVANQFLNERGDFGPSNDLNNLVSRRNVPQDRLRGLSDEQDQLGGAGGHKYFNQ